MNKKGWIINLIKGFIIMVIAFIMVAKWKGII
jgi:hypothetical protein